MIPFRAKFPPQLQCSVLPPAPCPGARTIAGNGPLPAAGTYRSAVTQNPGRLSYATFSTRKPSADTEPNAFTATGPLRSGRPPINRRIFSRTSAFRRSASARVRIAVTLAVRAASCDFALPLRYPMSCSLGPAAVCAASHSAGRRNPAAVKRSNALRIFISARAYRRIPRNTRPTMKERTPLPKGEGGPTASRLEGRVRGKIPEEFPYLLPGPAGHSFIFPEYKQAIWVKPVARHWRRARRLRPDYP